jgi:hypothetical protein
MDREGHDVQSCHDAAKNEPGFSRCGLRQPLVLIGKGTSSTRAVTSSKIIAGFSR